MRDNRIPIMLSDAELAAIDDWRYASKIATRAGAIRKLVEMGMAAALEQQRLGKIAEVKL